MSAMMPFFTFPSPGCDGLPADLSPVPAARPGPMRFLEAAPQQEEDEQQEQQQEEELADEDAAEESEDQDDDQEQDEHGGLLGDWSAVSFPLAAVSILRFVADCLIGSGPYAALPFGSIGRAACNGAAPESNRASVGLPHRA